jgi:hypothetical protein
MGIILEVVRLIIDILRRRQLVIGTVLLVRQHGSGPYLAVLESLEFNALFRRVLTVKLKVHCDFQEVGDRPLLELNSIDGPVPRRVSDHTTSVVHRV